ncbi:MAG: site-specific DNA-methyltransferase [Planctomycetota bacterium]|nr:site-specific DNA-methyltransferase [Planctomycetota bacterium]
MLEINKIHKMDAREGLKMLPDQSVDCVVSSPPFWALRDYGESAAVIWDGDQKCDHEFFEYGARLAHENRQNLDGGTIGNPKYREKLHGFGNAMAGFCSKCSAWKGQLGLEPIFELYLAHLLQIFGEIERVLKPTGTLWLHLGDTYSGSWGNYAPNGIKGTQRARTKAGQRWQRKAYQDTRLRPASSFQQSVKEKSLCVIPERFAVALLERGWILRNTVIWHKPNCMPSSAKDRFTVDYERLLFFVKSKKYFFDQQCEQHPNRNSGNKQRKIYNQGQNARMNTHMGESIPWEPNSCGRNKRCVWKIATKPFSKAHFAVFPEQLIETPIRAGCPQGGLVLDPFMGSGTTAVVAKKFGRNFLGFEINPQYVKMAGQRLAAEKKREVDRHAA